MRQLVVLALAPAIALGLALSAGTVVPDTPANTKIKPKSIVWGGRVFTTPGKLAHWLNRRDASYQVWVVRHPGASWFHKTSSRRAALATARTGLTKPVVSKKPLVTPKRPTSDGNDPNLALYGALGLAILLLTAALARVVSARDARHRPRPKREPTRGEKRAPPQRSLPAARVAALARPTRPTAVYAIPHAYPAPAARVHEPARTIPVYFPAEPEAAPEPQDDPEPPELVLVQDDEGETEPNGAAPSPALVEAAPEAAAPDGLDLQHFWELPKLAPPGSTWETCAIGLWHGSLKSQFYAQVIAPDGSEYALGLSRIFPGKMPFEPNEVARSAHVNLALELLEKGWRPDGHGDQWWSLRFRMGDD